MDDDAVQVATVAVIGDVHLLWDDADVAFFNDGGYDLLLFVGDLAGYTQLRGRGVARLLRKLRVPAMCVPGNHDGLHALQ
ncbi:MAG: metallophosphoesterase, partial [Polyangiales bacterium]